MIRSVTTMWPIAISLGGEFLDLLIVYVYEFVTLFTILSFTFPVSFVLMSPIRDSHKKNSKVLIKSLFHQNFHSHPLLFTPIKDVSFVEHVTTTSTTYRISPWEVVKITSTVCFTKKYTQPKPTRKVHEAKCPSTVLYSFVHDVILTIGVGMTPSPK